MSACPSCKAEDYVAGTPCWSCGALTASPPPHPELELDMPKRAPPKPKAPPKKKEEEVSLELAVDMNVVRPMASYPPTGGAGSAGHPSGRPGAPPPGFMSAPSHGAAAATAQGRTLAMHGAPGMQVGFESDEQIAARTLAGFGDPPTSALTAPLYTYRVFKRQQDLKKTLVGRREEATIASKRAEDALVAFGERARPLASGDPQSARTLQELKGAEELMRSRDHSLAREQDANAERLRSIDERIAGVEAELVAAQAAERKISSDLADAQSALQRAEARYKRAEIELRNQAAARERQTKVGR